MGGEGVAFLPALLTVASLLAVGFRADHRAQARPVWLLQLVDLDDRLSAASTSRLSILARMPGVSRLFELFQGLEPFRQAA
jgi:hypothetical protein